MKALGLQNFRRFGENRSDGGFKSVSRRWKGTRLFFFATAVLLLASGPTVPAKGEEDLQKKANEVFGPLPTAMTSPENPVTPEKVKLGSMLLWETRISQEGTVSCARCHPIGLYGADGLKKSIGDKCRLNPRNAPTIFNAAHQIAEHWTGARKNVEDQATKSVLGKASYGMPSYGAVEERLKAIPGYLPLFKAAFPEEKEPITMENFGKAVGAFERTLVTPGPFDAFMKGNAEALSNEEKTGLAAFMSTGCSTCHNSPYVGGQSFQKFGIFAPYWKYTGSKEIDLGRYEATKKKSDKYVFKVPVLRNVQKTPPYFHDGSVRELKKAIWIMGKVQLGKDLPSENVVRIHAFLGSLTGKIPEDAIKIPVMPSSK